MSSDWKQRLLDDPALFLVTYFPHKLRRLEEFHLRLILTATTRTRGLILYPAAHGKTTLVSTLLPIWALCADPNIRIALITKNDQDAKGIMQAIMAELLANEDLVRDFGPFYSEDRSFGLEKISVAKRTIRAKEPTIAAFGAGSRSALGHRTDWTICDDIITDLNSANPERRAKIKEWFMQGPDTMSEEADDRLTVVGTLFDPEDLYHDLIDLQMPDTGHPAYYVQREDAILDEEDHTTLWPARWPWPRLMERKAIMGTLDFNKRYRNIAVDKSRMVFREEHIKGGWVGNEKYPGCLDTNYRVGDFAPNWRKAAGFDPAVGLTRSKKFCAHMTLALGSCVDHEKCFWVVDLKRDQMTLPQQADLILDRHIEYELLTTKVEANSYQGGLLQVIEERMKRRNQMLRVEPHYTTRTNKPDPEAGVQAMAPWFEHGRVHIPWGDAASRNRMMQFVDELVQYPGRFTDTVMAFWFAWLALREASPRYGSFNRLQREHPLWGKRIGRRWVTNPYYEQEVPVATE